MFDYCMGDVIHSISRYVLVLCCDIAQSTPCIRDGFWHIQKVHASERLLFFFNSLLFYSQLLVVYVSVNYHTTNLPALKLYHLVCCLINIKNVCVVALLWRVFLFGLIEWEVIRGHEEAMDSLYSSFFTYNIMLLWLLVTELSVGWLLAIGRSTLAYCVFFYY